MKKYDGISRRITKSLHYGFDFVAGCSTIAGVWGVTIRDIKEQMSLKCSFLILIAAFVAISFTAFVVISIKCRKGVNVKINGKTISIKVGDIFSQAGWKTIPCNEYFDTIVDDRIIARNTLNGKMICEHIGDNIGDLKRTIESAPGDSSPLKPKKHEGRYVYPLGRVIPYNDFIMLAFTHFSQDNKAFIDLGEYETCMMRMWSELRRVYAAKHICIPLIGSGITDINGMHVKDNTILLKCILCTLRRSGFAPDSGLDIILTQESFDSIDIDKIIDEY